MSNILIECCCLQCGDVVTSSSLSRHMHFSHQYTYPRPPRYTRNCKHCDATIRTYSPELVFCNSSCAASHNNTGRVRSEESRKRTSDAINAFHENNPSVTTRSTLRLPKPPKPPKPIKMSTCAQCGVEFVGNRKTCSRECYIKRLSIHATNNPKMGGNKNTRAYGWYDSPIAGRVYLESSYEHRVAVELDLYGIQWTRPKYLPYLGNTKKYFPDFYLVDYDVYLDPKNDYLIIQDADKINRVCNENGVRVIILNKTQLSWVAIQQLL